MTDPGLGVPLNFNLIILMNLICFTGKQKYTLPIYKALMKSSNEMKQFAEKVFDETKMMLHINVREYVTKILQR
jgi:aminopeptidase B